MIRIQSEIDINIEVYEGNSEQQKNTMNDLFIMNSDQRYDIDYNRKIVQNAK